MPPGHRFCGQCGARLPTDQPLLDRSPQLSQAATIAQLPSPTLPDPAGVTFSARREVTVLFLDVTDFTAAAHSLDSEEVYLWMNETLRLLAAVVHKYEGTIDKFTGDGLMA
jgi:class 3 adenylate cyclase